MNKAEMLEMIENAEFIRGRNSMGCAECFYNSAYTLKTVFEKSELEAMSEKELNNLFKLADFLSEAFY